MKINKKDYALPKLLTFLDDNPIYEEITDPLSTEWNNLHCASLSEDSLIDLKTKLNHCKVEIDTLITTYDLLYKGVLKEYNVVDSNEDIENIDVLRPCIEYFNKGVDIFTSQTEQISEKNKIFFYLKFKDYVFIQNLDTEEYFEEQNLENDYYTITIKKGHSDLVSNINNNHLKNLGLFIINNNIRLDRNLYFINLYISKMFILDFKDEKSIILNYGKMLEDGYGEHVFLIKEDIYKIKRNEDTFSVYKNEKVIL